MPNFKVALVGVGQRGLQHLQALCDLQEEELVTIVALVDPFVENLAKEKITSFVPNYSESGVALYTDYEEFLESSDVDGIWFVIPPNQHTDQIVKAAEKGIAIFAEKPQSLFLDEIYPMAEAIEKYKVPSICGFQMEYDYWYTKIKEYLNDKWVSSITMVDCGAVEMHGVKHTQAEKKQGPENRIWTADRKWSGTSMVEAGIHQTDLMRFWTNDNISWVQSSYVERPEQSRISEGDNPIAYHVTYGFNKGGIGNLIMTRPGGVFYTERYDYILTEKSMIKFEDDLIAYGLDSDHYDINKRREHFKKGNVFAEDQLKKVIAKGPHENAMGQHNTKSISENFINSIIKNDSALRFNSFKSSINSLSAVLAANASSALKGEKISLADFETSSKYSGFRSKNTS